MIREYALEPELVATWGDLANFRFFRDKFGSAQGRLVSCFPKKWPRMVYTAFGDGDGMDKKRLEVLLTQLKNEAMVKRENWIWNENTGWSENAFGEHSRCPFTAILARENREARLDVLCEDDLQNSSCPLWETPHGRIVNRKASEMADAVRQMLFCCRWVKFVDPYFVQCKPGHAKSLSAFLDILKKERPVGMPKKIEIHTKVNGAAPDYLKKFFEKIVPVDLQITLYQWQERPKGQKLHNRYILTDLGGVAFLHGLDVGQEGEIDDLTRLDRDQYNKRCRDYNLEQPAFDLVSPPLLITGTRKMK